jgi:O-antigen/teichoic acid export membrane protein
LNPIKKLAGQTAIYGLPTILGRFLSYLLVFLQVRVFKQPDKFSVVPEFYAYVSFLFIILTYGMETAYFRYSLKQKENKSVYPTTLLSILISTSVFILFVLIFSQTIATKIGYPAHPEYIVWFGWILALDTLAAIPFAKLRIENRPVRFAFIKSLNIFTWIFLQIIFLFTLPWLLKNPQYKLLYTISNFIYNPKIGVGYIFISNLVASVLTIVFLAPQYLKTKYTFDKKLWKEMFNYAWPLLILGLAGIVNETFDRALMKWIIPPSNNPQMQLGIYGVCYKLSIIMTLFITTFRFAAEPFFFSHASQSDSKQIYSTVMNWFMIVCSFIFLGVMLNINILKYLITSSYWPGLKIVPVLLIANMFLGIFYNLSIWYKLTDRTKLGALVSIIGAAITIILNFLLVPVMGYMGAAWATLACYFSVMVISYILGQKYYPIQYNLGKFFLYLGSALLLYGLNTLIKQNETLLIIITNNLFLIPLMLLIIKVEKINVKALILKLK